MGSPYNPSLCPCKPTPHITIKHTHSNHTNQPRPTHSTPKPTSTPSQTFPVAFSRLSETTVSEFLPALTPSYHSFFLRFPRSGNHFTYLSGVSTPRSQVAQTLFPTRTSLDHFKIELHLYIYIRYPRKSTKLPQSRQHTVYILTFPPSQPMHGILHNFNH